MSLHDQIMNLPSSWPTSDDMQPQAWRYAYKCGHRDARHAAAELAIAVEQQRDELLAALKHIHGAAMDITVERASIYKAASVAIFNAEAKQ